MSIRSLLSASGVIFVAHAAIVFDGRVPASASLADFDSATSIFNPDFTKGQSRW